MRPAPFLLALMVLCAPAAARADDARITVGGTGVVSARPDLARINIGVRSSADTAQDATAANAETMRSVFAVLSDLDIDEADIRTDRVALSPNWDWERGPGGREAQTLRGYDAINMVHVTVRDVTRVGAVLDMLIAAGANESAGIAFDIEDRAALLDEARKAAVADARRKAALYASAAGVALGPLQGLSENTGFGPPMMMQAAAGAMMADAMPTPVAPGETDLSVSIIASWAITPQ